MNIIEQTLSIVGMGCLIIMFITLMCVCYKLINLLDQVTKQGETKCQINVSH